MRLTFFLFIVLSTLDSVLFFRVEARFVSIARVRLDNRALQEREELGEETPATSFISTIFVSDGLLLTTAEGSDMTSTKPPPIIAGALLPSETNAASSTAGARDAAAGID